MLSDQFDAMVDEQIELSNEMNFGRYSPNKSLGIDIDDGPAMREWFNNWTDSLCQDGQIHSLQYENYTNVGKYANAGE